MKKNLNKSLLAFALSSLLATSVVHATNGYFLHGYGTKNKGLAGGGAALPQDAMIAATNPAGMVWVGERMDIGAALFSPQRQYTVTGDTTPDGPPFFDLAVENVESDSELFLIPHFARNWMLDSKSSVGVTVYGNGGMNTDYPATAGFGQGTFFGASAGGAANTGIDLSQLFINTTYSRQINSKSSYGVSLVMVYQRFKATGLAAFSPFSASPANLTDNGFDDSLGFGAKLGWQGEVSPDLTLAASYQTKMSMDKFDKYAGLFAEQGGFDIPSTWTVGLAYDIASAGTLTFDVQSIMFSGVKSIGNSFLPNLQTSQLGNSDGAGFGYEDINVYKLGYQWSANSDLTLRAGFSIGDQPIPTSEVMFNILAPAVMTTHITGGFTLKMGSDNELNFAAMYAPSESVTGPNFLSGSSPDQNIEIEMTQWELEASWAWKY